MTRFPIILLAVVALLCMGCSRAVHPDHGEGPLRVVATTTFIADVVTAIGGEAVELHVLIPPGTDPHSAVFRPADLARAAEAHVLFVNGGRLEGQIDRLLANAGRRDRIVSLDRNIPARSWGGHSPACHQHCEHATQDHHHDHGDVDPHFWTDPHNIMIWADTIADTLSALLPDAEDSFRANALAYQQKLQELDEWILERVATLPEEHRRLVTDHLSLGYFADRYGFEQAGVILRGFDTLAQPTARELAALMNVIRDQNVPAIFIGSAVNPALATQITRDTGTQLVVLPSDSLTPADGVAPDYISYMRYNVNALVDNLARPVH